MKIAPVTALSVAALVGATAGFVAYRHYAAGQTRLRPIAAAAAPPAASSAATATPSPPGTAAVSDASAAPALTIPEEVPDLRLQDLAGKLQPLRDRSGHSHLYNFWATWCEPCRREIPLLNSLQVTHRAEGLQIVGIAVDFHDAVRKFLNTTQLHYALRVGEEDGLEAAQKFGMDLVLPFSVFADGQNRIVAVKVGELHREEADAILAQMRALGAGRTTLAAARAAISSTLKELALERAKQSKPI